jgi:transcriptional antiterminator NusG
MKLVDPSKAWFVVRASIRAEEKAASSIRLAGFDVYLPKMRLEKKHRRTNTYSEVERPLMPGYLFVGFTSFARHFGMVRDCDGVYKLLEVQGEPIQVPSQSVVEIQCAETDMRFDDTRKARQHRKEEARTKRETTRMQFPAGSNVVVSDTDSPFSSFKAVVEEVTRTGHVKALVNLFGRMVPAEFEEKQLKPAA